MLRELHISGLGVIEDVDLELDAGLNVLTGETGAGKTMITVGLTLTMGSRGSAALVRSGARTARVQARFDAPEGVGEWAEEGELVLGRTIASDGRSSARVCGQIATVSTLSALGARLVEVHGQNQGQRLLSPAVQARFLDRFAGREHVATVEAFRETFRALRAARDRLHELTGLARERERERDLLAYQVREIEAAGVAQGELALLAAEEARLAHVERLLEKAAAAESGLIGEGAGLDALRAAGAALAEATEVDRGAGDVASRALGLAEEAEELARDVRRYRETLQADPERLADVRERVVALRALERKYGDGEEGILVYLAEARSRLASLSGLEDERRELHDRIEGLEARATALAGQVSQRRATAAPRLARALQGELGSLGMDGASLEVRLERLKELEAEGGERIEIRFSGGPAQPSLPLGHVASGGELSRVMLGCRSVLADLDDVPTLVFDEVDAGIGGRAAVAVGRRLARLARSRQVLVVTHLPQIAAFADRHLRVEKRDGSATVTGLSEGERVAELSRMLSGLAESRRAASHAAELLAEAARAKAGT